MLDSLSLNYFMFKIRAFGLNIEFDLRNRNYPVRCNLN